MKMPKFGMMTGPTEDVARQINKAYGLGMDYVEICLEPPEAMPAIITKNKNKILKALKPFSYRPIVHTAYWDDLGSPYGKIRKAWIEEMKNEIIIASKLKAEKFNIHFDARGILREKKYRKLISDNYVLSLKELVSFARKYRIKIIFENTPYKWADLENFMHLVSRVPGIYVHLDIGHIFVTDGIAGIKKFISYFSNRIEHVHIHDNYGKADDHLPLGKGKIDFSVVVRELKKIGYNKTITFEVFTSDKDFINSIKFFRRLWLK